MGCRRKEEREEREEGHDYLMVGTFLALIIFLGMLLLIGSNAVDSFTARSFLPNYLYNVISSSHTAPTICFCITEMRRKE